MLARMQIQPHPLQFPSLREGWLGVNVELAWGGAIAFEKAYVEIKKTGWLRGTEKVENEPQAARV